MTDQPTDHKAIAMDILSKISEKCPGLDWQMRCTYSNGHELHYYCITIFDNQKKAIQEVITFEAKSGRILAVKRPYFSSPAPRHIIDALLEVLHRRQ